MTAWKAEGAMKRRCGHVCCDPYFCAGRAGPPHFRTDPGACSGCTRATRRQEERALTLRALEVAAHSPLFTADEKSVLVQMIDRRAPSDLFGGAA